MKEFFKQPLKLYNKADNANFQEALTLNRIDEALGKVFRLKLDFGI